MMSCFYISVCKLFAHKHEKVVQQVPSSSQMKVRIMADSPNIAIKNLYFWLNIALCFLLIIPFVPTFFMDFGIHNDYHINTHGILSYPETFHLFRIGRPLGALLLNLQFMCFRTIHHLAYGRLLAALFQLPVLWSIYFTVRQHIQASTSTILAIAALILLLPQSLIGVLWLTNFVPISISLFLVCAGYFLLDSKTLPLPSTRFVIGWVIIFLTFFIYPPTSYFFLFFTATKVLFTSPNRWSQTRTEVWRDISFCAIISFAYFLTISICNHMLISLIFAKDAPTNIVEGRYRFELTTDILGQIGFVRRLFSFCSDLWIGETGVGVYIFLLAAILTLIKLKRAHHSFNYLSSVSERIAFLLLLFMLSSAPMIAAVDGYFSYHNTISATAILVISLIRILRYLVAKHSATALAILFSLALLTASIRTNLAALNASQELSYIRGQLADTTNIQAISVLLPVVGDGFISSPFLTTEFSLLATNVVLVDGIFKAVLSELSPEYANIPIRPIVWGEPLSPEDKNPPEGRKVVDLTRAGFAKTTSLIRKGIHRQELSVGIVLSTPARQSLSHLTDGSAEIWSYLEMVGSYPFWIRLEYANPKPAFGYYLQEGAEVSQRMPTAWRVEGSNDDQNWTLLDERQSEPPWHARELRHYIFRKPAHFRTYRFFFTSGLDSQILRLFEVGIDPLEKNISTAHPILAEKGYKGFNIIFYQDKYYGLDQNEGPFYIAKVEKKEYKRCFIGNSVDEVKHLVDKFLKIGVKSKPDPKLG